MGKYNEWIAGEILKFTGVDVKEMLEIGILPPKEAKKWLIKKRYFEMAKTGMTYTDIKYELSIIYEISVSAIEKMIYRK